jgi:hypothetical protein
VSAAIYLSHGVLAALLLLSVWVRQDIRSRAVAAVAAVGAASGIVLMFSAQSDETWRTATFGSAIAVVGAAIACAWLITGLADARAGRWQTGVLVGVAGSGAALAAANEWVVPALLFWATSSLAVAALVSGGPGRVAVWLALFASDACLVAGLIGNSLDTDSWLVPRALTGWPLVVVLASAVLRAGVLPLTGIWGALGSEGAPALPLISAGAFVAIIWALGDPVPWLGVGLVVVAILTAIAGLLRAELSVPLIAAAPVSLGLGAAVAEPSAAVAAGVASVIAVALVALWPAVPGRGEAPRALHLAFVPPTIGFVAVVAAAVATFDRAVESDRIADTVVNTLFSALLPVAVAVSVGLGARIARMSEEVVESVRTPNEARALSVVTWALLAASVALAVVPPEILSLEGQPLGSIETRVLLAAAAVIGAGVAYVAWRRRARSSAPKAVADTEEEVVDPDEETTTVLYEAGAPERVKTTETTEEEPATALSFRPLAPATEKRSGKVLAYVAIFLALAMVASVGWFTVYGMRLGFL